MPVEPKDLVTVEGLAISNMWETSALVELLERKGILTKQEVLDLIQELRQREARGARRGLWADPHAVPPWEWRRMRKRYR